MLPEVIFEVLMSCSGETFSYTHGQRLTLDVDISADTATDLLAAGHIRQISSSESNV
jgi:hypothetical protein